MAHSHHTRHCLLPLYDQRAVCATEASPTAEIVCVFLYLLEVFAAILAGNCTTVSESIVFRAVELYYCSSLGREEGERQVSLGSYER